MYVNSVVVKDVKRILQVVHTFMLLKPVTAWRLPVLMSSTGIVKRFPMQYFMFSMRAQTSSITLSYLGAHLSGLKCDTTSRSLWEASGFNDE